MTKEEIIERLRVIKSLQEALAEHEGWVSHGVLSVGLAHSDVGGLYFDIKSLQKFIIKENTIYWEALDSDRRWEDGNVDITHFISLKQDDGSFELLTEEWRKHYSQELKARQTKAEARQREQDRKTYENLKKLFEST